MTPWTVETATDDELRQIAAYFYIAPDFKRRVLAEMSRRGLTTPQG